MRRSNIAEEKMLMTNPPVNLEFEVVHLCLPPVCVLVILGLAHHHDLRIFVAIELSLLPFILNDLK